MRQREAKISDGIRAALDPLPGVVLWRNSPTLAKVRGGRAWCGLPRGSADLVGIVEVNLMSAEGPRAHPVKLGRFFALEVKAPGEIPSDADIVRILAKLGPLGALLKWDEFMIRGPAWERAISKLDEGDRHVLQQEAWLSGVSLLGGFGCFVDSVNGALAALNLARIPGSVCRMCEAEPAVTRW